MELFDEEQITLGEIQLEIERLREHWRIFGYGAILIACARNAQNEQLKISQNEYLQTLPFVNQKLAQWVVADRECPACGTKALSNSSFQSLFEATYKIVHELAPAYLLKTYGINALRAMAFQQFEYQSSSRFALRRQLFITNQLPHNHRLLSQPIFEEGLSGSDLLLGSYILGAYAIQHAGQPISYLSLSSANGWFPKDKLVAVLNIHSADQNALRRRFCADERKSISVFSAMHRPAFRSKPLFEISRKKYLMWSPTLLLGSLGNAVLHSLSESGDKDLIAEFGKIFESKYVATALKSLCATVFPEAEIKVVLRSGERVVDFLLIFGNAVVLVESKMKSADEATQFAIKDTQIGDRLKGSIIKAIDQGQSTGDLIRAGRFEKFGIRADAKLFLIIVTTDQHYMGTGVDVAERTGGERVASLGLKYEGEFPIPLENISLLTADGLDTLALLCERGETTVLKHAEGMRAQQVSNDPSERVMVGELLLRSTDSNALPSYLLDTQNAWIRQVLSEYGGPGVKRFAQSFRNSQGERSESAKSSFSPWKNFR